MKPLSLFWSSALLLGQTTAHSCSHKTTTTTTTTTSASIPPTGTILTGPFPSDLHGSNWTYPWPVKVFRFISQGSPQEMAFMDLPPSLAGNTTPETKQKQKVAILLHGKNFCSATWPPTASLLQSTGYRVILPDQLGFCKSSKPVSYQFTLAQLALNTKNFLAALNLTSSSSSSSSAETTLTVIGHSMGGMLATRFALLYPSLISNLVLVNPIGLEDWISLGVPYPSIDSTYATERASNYTTIKAYQQATYYMGSWSSKYDPPVVMLSNIYIGSQAEAFAWCQARVGDMVLTQPVVYEFKDLKVPRTLLMIGTKDTTAIGKPSAPPEVQAKLGHYDVLGKQAAAVIPNSTLIEFEDMGHAPQIQGEERFHEALLGWLEQ
ncbi:Alpha/Beta hydrolase protein [Cladorrhinum sp. PSN259]|nr:Alpha/Beta hydrolase protein [Cladorrhinum sp. PSN259]